MISHKPPSTKLGADPFVDITWVNEFYGEWAQPNDDEFDPGAHALGGGPFPGVVGFAQSDLGDPGLGDFIQRLQAGQLNPFFTNCPAVP